MDNLVFSNFLHRPARTIVSALGISVGVLLIVFTVGLANGSIRGQARRDANIGAQILFRSSGATGLGGSTFLIPIARKTEIERVQGVLTAIPLGQNTVEAKESNIGQRIVDGIEFEDYSKTAGLTIVQGRKLADYGDEAIIDTAWQRQMKLKVGDPFEVYGRKFTIVGTYEPAAGARIKIPLSTMQRQLEREGKVSSFLVKTKAETTPDKVARDLAKAFPDNQVILTKDLEELYMSSIPALDVFLNVFIGIAAVVSGLVILLTMYTTVNERTRQFGILKSLGMSNYLIGLIITQEAILICLSGVFVGTAGAFVLRWVLNLFITLEVEMSLYVLLLVFIIVIAGGTIGALLPAAIAARLDAVDALNYD